MERMIPERYDFDREINRRGTHSVKYAATEGLESDYEHIIPLWVADMDFETPAVIKEALVRSITENPVLGYSVPPKAYFDTLVKWFESEYGLAITPDEIVYTPGVVAALYKLIECFTGRGDGITILPPVYFPFSDVIEGSGRRKVLAPLVIENGRYFIDWEKLEECLKESKVMIFCHPHNPGGRVWSDEELRRVAALAKKLGVIVFSDEIHADLTFRPHRHKPFAAVCDEAREAGITLMAPSKFFNMPGVIGSHMYIPDRTLREKAFGYLEANHLGAADCFTFDAIIAAYSHAAEWAKEAVRYCGENVRFVKEYLAKELPEIGMIEPEASFLVFLDFRKAGFGSTEELSDFIIRKAGVLMNEGSAFGPGGAFFMRLNVGTCRSVLEEALGRLKKAFRER